MEKKINFNIISDNSTDGHGGFGVGTLSLNSMSPVIISPEDGEAYIDMGAMHAKAAIEKRIKFTTDRADAPNGKLYWIVWVTVGRKPEGFYYGGVAACDLLVDVETRRGFKILADHVNKMDKSLKGRIVVDQMDDTSKGLLREFLMTHKPEMWVNAEPELHDALA